LSVKRLSQLNLRKSILSIILPIPLLVTSVFAGTINGYADAERNHPTVHASPAGDTAIQLLFEETSSEEKTDRALCLLHISLPGRMDTCSSSRLNTIYNFYRIAGSNLPLHIFLRVLRN
jgi:hypothetical protein